MSEENKTKFGNMPLGRINEMLVSFIGEDAFLDYCCPRKEKDDSKKHQKEKDYFRKHLERLFKEETGKFSYCELNPHYPQSVYRIACKILGKFCEEYGLPRYIADTILDFYKLMTLQLSKTEYPICETHYLFDIVICGILPIFVKKTVAEIDTNNEISFSYLDAETKYDTVFNELGEQFESLENFYRELDSYAGKIEHFKTIILNHCKKGQNPATWNDMKAILDFCKEKGKDLEMSHLIEAYITANVQNFIKAEIPESDWKKIKSCFESIGENVFNKFIAEKKKSGDTTYLKEKCLYLTMTPLGLLHQMLLESMEDKSEPINLALWNILKRHIYLQDEKRAEDLISNTSGFYCNWLLAYIAVAKGEFEIAKIFYKAAFDNIHFAGIWTEPFLKQAFALSVYWDANPDAVRNVIDPDPEKHSKTPLPNDGKRFWEYGYAIGVFDKPAEDAFLEYVYRKENFSTEFPEDMFFPAKGIDFNKIKLTITERIKEKIEEEYNRLSALKKGSINTRLIIFNGDGQRRSPLSAAMWLFSISSDERFLDLVERWFDLFDQELDFNKISDLGETPLNAATMVYKDFCAKNSDTKSPVKKRLKKIITHIFGKTKEDYLGIATKRKGIHPLQNIIDSCDIELIKEFVEGGLDIDSIRFPPDGLSPIHYIIDRIVKLQDPKQAARAMLENPENTNWEYADVPGINAEDRKRNFFEKMKNFSPEIQQLIAEYAIKEELGDESTYKTQIEKLKEICLYLIDHTNKREEYLKLFESCDADFTINPTNKSKEKPQ